jgi:hypothetical protein
MGLWICVLIPDWLRVCFLALEVCFFFNEPAYKYRYDHSDKLNSPDALIDVLAKWFTIPR